ncbi:MAG: DNA repair and recombination protein RadA, partial [Thermoproteota archaeon]
RIYFKKSGKKRIARMVDSPHHPEEEVIFALGEAGVMDLEDTEKKPAKKTAKKVTKKEKESEPEITVESAELEMVQVTDDTDSDDLESIEE